MDSDPDWAAQNLAIDLKQAGLLTADLPEPVKMDDHAYRWYGTHTCLTNCCETCMEIEPEMAGGVSVHGHGKEAHIWVDVDNGEQLLTPEDARSLGLALLAAANYSEEP